MMVELIHPPFSIATLPDYRRWLLRSLSVMIPQRRIDGPDQFR